MFNLNRVDGDKLDQMPYGVAYNSSGPTSGVLIQHGNYHEQRTINLPEDYSKFVALSGLYPHSEFPDHTVGGPISDLKYGSSQEAAFSLLVRKIEHCFPMRANPQTLQCGIEVEYL